MSFIVRASNGRISFPFGRIPFLRKAYVESITYHINPLQLTDRITSVEMSIASGMFAGENGDRSFRLMCPNDGYEFVAHDFNHPVNILDLNKAKTRDFFDVEYKLAYVHEDGSRTTVTDVNTSHLAVTIIAVGGTTSGQVDFVGDARVDQILRNV